MKYLLVISFFLTVSDLFAQNIKCDVELSEIEEVYFNGFKDVTFVSFRFTPIGKVDRQSINIINSLGDHYDSIARAVLINAPKKSMRSNITSCRIVPILFKDEFSTEMLKRNPNSNEVIKRFMRNDKYELAKELLKIGLKVEGYQDAEKHFLLYQCYKALNKQESACIYLEEAKRLNTKYRKVWKQNCK